MLKDLLNCQKNNGFNFLVFNFDSGNTFLLEFKAGPHFCLNSQSFSIKRECKTRTKDKSNICDMSKYAVFEMIVKFKKQGLDLCRVWFLTERK